ncbi:Mrp/NBP35 family ATP-binding protein [Methanospirillum sp.]
MEHSQKSNLPERANINVRHVILVLSGKGGVGKSTVSVNLAYALAMKGKQVGLLDLDIHGPNVPKMLGIEKHQLLSENNKLIPVRVLDNLQVVSMAFLLPHRNSPVVWRGPMKSSAIRQFLEDTAWEPLDYLIVDLPPGTGDEALTVAQSAPNISGAVIVTSPQSVSTLDSSKAITFSRDLGIEVLGVIENMSGYICPSCKKEVDIFGKGGGEKIAEEMDVPYLGNIPVDVDIRRSCDEGWPYVAKITGSPAWSSIHTIIEKLNARIEKSK